MENKKQITLYDYVFPLISKEKNFLIPIEKLREMVDLKNLKSLTVMLAKYYPKLSELGPNPDLEEIHHFFHEDFIEKIYKIVQASPNSARPFLMNFLIEFEIENLTTILRSRVIMKSTSEITERVHWQVEEFTNNKEIIEKIIKQTNFSAIFELLKQTVYREFIIKAQKRFKVKKTLVYVNTYLDHGQIVLMMRTMERLSKFDKKVTSEYVNLMVEYFNLMILFRGKSFDMETEEIKEFLIPNPPSFKFEIINTLLPLGDLQSVLESLKRKKIRRMSSFLDFPDSTNSYFDILSHIEKKFYQKLLKFVNKLKSGNPFSICTPLAFILSKKLQIRDLIRISSGIEYNFPKDIILDRIITF